MACSVTHLVEIDCKPSKKEIKVVEKFEDLLEKPHLLLRKQHTAFVNSFAVNTKQTGVGRSSTAPQKHFQKVRLRRKNCAMPEGVTRVLVVRETGLK
jgi:hypothetical protein